MLRTWTAPLAVALVLAACATQEATPMTTTTATMTLTSAAFEEGGAIPQRHGCDGENVSPPIAWSGAPEQTAAFALIVDDPDARGFVHWTVADIPAEVTELDEGASGVGVEGSTSFRETGYGGPCPPSGSHRYVFEVVAVSERLGLSPGFSADELRSALSGKILGSGRITGTYARGG